MGFFSFGSKESKTYQTTSETNTSSNTADQAGDAAAGQAAVKAGAGRDLSIAVTDSRVGLTGGDVGQLLNAALSRQQAAVDAVTLAGSQTTNRLADLAAAATGAQTETGQLIGRLAVPVAAVIGGVILLLFFLKRDK